MGRWVQPVTEHQEARGFTLARGSHSCCQGQGAFSYYFLPLAISRALSLCCERCFAPQHSKLPVQQVPQKTCPSREPLDVPPPWLGKQQSNRLSTCKGQVPLGTRGRDQWLCLSGLLL